MFSLNLLGSYNISLSYLEEDSSLNINVGPQLSTDEKGFSENVQTSALPASAAAADTFPQLEVTRMFGAFSRRNRRLMETFVRYVIVLLCELGGWTEGEKVSRRQARPQSKHEKHPS